MPAPRVSFGCCPRPWPFPQSSRQLLNGGVTVHFEWIELAFDLDVSLVTMENLGFGFDLQLAQLIPQAGDRLGQFVQVEFEGAELLLQAGPIDTHFTRCIEQGLEKLGVFKAP